MRGPHVPGSARLGLVATVTGALTVLGFAALVQVFSPHLSGALAPQLPPFPRGGDPLVAAAGDVACSPASAFFRAGLGTQVNCRQSATAALLERGGYDAVLGLGDLQYESGELEAFRASFAPSWGRVVSVLRPAPGNHEYNIPGAEGYFAFFGERAGDPHRGWYSFDLGSWHLVALNSNCDAVGGCGPRSEQVRWLRADLEAHPASCVLAYWHHPRFSSGATHGGDVRFDAFWRALHEARADVVLVGHEHQYERFAPLAPDGRPSPGGIRQFVVGTGGKSLYGFGATLPGSEARDASSFGVLELALRPGRYEWRFLPATGSFVDRGAGRCVS